MKSTILVILGILVGLIIGGKLGYDYVMEYVTTQGSSLVDTMVVNGVASGSQILIQQAQGQASQVVEEQKGLIKEQLKKQVTEYLNKKIDESF